MRVQVVGAVGRVVRPTALSRFRPFGTVLLMLAAAGCFTYNDLPQTAASPGRDVRVDLNPTGRTALANQLGPEVRSVTGRLDSADSLGLTVAIAKTTMMDGDENGWHGEHVVIPYSDVAQTGERTLSKGKTVALVALLSGAMSGLALLVGRATASAGTGSGLPSASK
jgi:hypothetical protein